MSSKRDAQATSRVAATTAATGYAVRSSRAFSSEASATRSNEAYIFPSTFEQGEACWIPAASSDEAEKVLNNVILDRAAVYQRKSVPVAFQAVQDLAFARDDYLTKINLIRENWEAAGKIVTKPIAQSISDARSSLRFDIRARYRVSGFMAKAYDVYRYGSTDEYIRQTKEKVATLLDQGQYRKVIDNALKTDDLANKMGAVAKTGLPVAKALAVGGYVAIGIEIPYRVYQLDQAATDEERGKALEALTSATVSGTYAVACLLLGIETAGVGFLACGVAPVVSGIFAGEAAKWIYLNHK